MAQRHLESELLNRLHGISVNEIITQRHLESGILNRLYGISVNGVITQRHLESGILNLESAGHRTRPSTTVAPSPAQREP
jgi:hypothetical protein